MHYRRLGHTDISVSLICLGTMTFGEQNTESEAHDQLDLALERGVNFIDTAELYPVPPRAETFGVTEEYIGSWLAKGARRERVVLASKVAGPGPAHIRGGPRLTAEHVQRALDDSLQRLRTDYLDLYQIHWPARQANYFGRLGFEPAEDADATPLAETLTALGDAVSAGKVRAIGLSNETPWGVMQALKLAETMGLPRPVSIQNPYNLLNRSYEVGLAEISHREGVGLLAYSPLAFGMLSGKYEGGAQPAGARLTLFERFQRYTHALGREATHAYVELARQWRLDPAQMALAYVNSRPFLTSNIIGATTLAQLQANLGSLDLSLPTELLEAIETIHRRQPNPCP